MKFHYMEKGKLEQSYPTLYSELNGLCKRHTCRNPAEIREHTFLSQGFSPNGCSQLCACSVLLPGPGTGAEAEEIKKNGGM